MGDVFAHGGLCRFSAVLMRVRSRIRGDDDVVPASERMHNFSVRLEDEAKACYRVECLDAGYLTARRETSLTRSTCRPGRRRDGVSRGKDMNKLARRGAAAGASDRGPSGSSPS